MTDDDIMEYAEPISEEDDYDSEVQRLVFEGLEEDSDVSADGWSPKKKSG